MSNECGARGANAWHSLGLSLLRRGDRSGAVAAFSAALQLDRAHVLSRLALGNVWFDSGQYERALQCFEIAEAGPRT